jgi:ferredoxin
MGISKIWIEEGCTACGLCEEICPEVFKLKEISTVIENANYDDNKEKIKEAAESCPVEVIRYIE